MRYIRNTSGFTLVELVLVMTIFAVMSTAIISIYLQTTMMSARLKATRYLTETAREITERISDGVRTSGMSGVTISPHTHLPWTTSSYSLGMEVLGIGDGSQKYLYGKKTNSGIIPCTTPDKKDAKIHCGLYLVSGTDYVNGYNLVDSFIPDEQKKRVKINDLKFYRSGDGISTEQKVTLVFELMLMPRIGVSNISTENSTLRVQTTITARPYQSF